MYVWKFVKLKALYLETMNILEIWKSSIFLEDEMVLSKNIFSLEDQNLHQQDKLK